MADEEEVAAPVDLTAPRLRAAALRAMTRELAMGAGFCPDRSRAVATRMLDAGLTAAATERDAR